MWCYRFSRQCVVSIVVKMDGSDAAGSSDAYKKAAPTHREKVPPI
jgi:hypothetical protein